MGAYLFGLSTGDLRSTWEEDSSEGWRRRVSFQNYMGCCGFDSWTESLGALYTDCPFIPQTVNDPTPQTCEDAGNKTHLQIALSNQPSNCDHH